MRINHGILLTGVTLAALAAAAGCKKKEQDAQTGGYQQGGQQPYGQQPYGQQPQQPYGQQPQGTAPPPATAAPPPATAAPPAGTAAQPIDASMAAAATPILQGLSQQWVVAGAKPLGNPAAANFAQGQVLEVPIQLNPGRCYTIVAAGVPPIAEVNLQVIVNAPIPGLAPVLAQDTDTGATAVIGKKPDCYKWALMVAAPAKIVMTVASGSGMAALQVYEK